MWMLQESVLGKKLEGMVIQTTPSNKQSLVLV